MRRACCPPHDGPPDPRLLEARPAPRVLQHRLGQSAEVSGTRWRRPSKRSAGSRSLTPLDARDLEPLARRPGSSGTRASARLPASAAPGPRDRRASPIRTIGGRDRSARRSRLRGRPPRQPRRRGQARRPRGARGRRGRPRSPGRGAGTRPAPRHTAKAASPVRRGARSTASRASRSRAAGRGAPAGPAWRCRPRERPSTKTAVAGRARLRDARAAASGRRASSSI